MPSPVFFLIICSFSQKLRNQLQYIKM